MPLFFFHIKENGDVLYDGKVRICPIWTLRARKRSRASGKSSAPRSWQEARSVWTARCTSTMTLGIRC